MSINTNLYAKMQGMKGDKMKFNMFQFLHAIYVFQDLVEKELFGQATNNYARVIYVSLKMGRILKLSDYEILDLLFLALLRDNGMSAKEIFETHYQSVSTGLIPMTISREHCIRGEDNLQRFPFFSNPQNVIMYHHEHYDGTGVFGMKGENIPLMSQIIFLASNIDSVYNFDLVAKDPAIKDSMKEYVKNNKSKLFSEKITESFLRLANDDMFWNVFLNHEISNAVKKETATYNFDFTFSKIREMTSIFSRITDMSSSFTTKHSATLARNMEQMIQFYKFDEDHRQKLLIASDLHDIGKLGIHPAILEKKGSLTKNEFVVIQRHPLIGYKSINQIKGLKDVAKWILNHHEKCDGSGYPRGLFDEDLDFESKLLGCLDIYTALREDRSYRPEMTQEEAFIILFDMANRNLIDKGICEDIKHVFYKLPNQTV